MALYEVIGGADKGGILVREGQDLKSNPCEERLSTGAIVETLQLIGDRLHYELVEGTGPKEGWVSLKISGKELLMPKDENLGGPGKPGRVEVDEELKTAMEAEAAEHDKQGSLHLFCPRYKVLGAPLDDCRFRILCFHSMGSAESTFTNPAHNLIKWVKETKKIEMLAVDYPGRDKMMKMKHHTSQDTLCPLLLAVLYSKMNDGIPYVIWGHSVGTWVAFEFLLLVRKCGLPMPKAAFFNAFPAPHMPAAQRRWRRSRVLDTAEIKQELMSWDKQHWIGPGKVVYEEPTWTETWETLMRHDFKLYDEYKFKHNGAPPFDFNMHCWHLENDNHIKAEMIKMWSSWTTGKFDFKSYKDMGHLTCLYHPEHKKKFLGDITSLIQDYSEL